MESLLKILLIFWFWVWTRTRRWRGRWVVFTTFWVKCWFFKVRKGSPFIIIHVDESTLRFLELSFEISEFLPERFVVLEFTLLALLPIFWVWAIIIPVFLTAAVSTGSSSCLFRGFTFGYYIIGWWVFRFAVGSWWSRFLTYKVSFCFYFLSVYFFGIGPPMRASLCYVTKPASPPFFPHFSCQFEPHINFLCCHMTVRLI